MRRLLPVGVFVALISSLITLPWETELEYSFVRDATPLEVGRDLDEASYTRRTVLLDGPLGNKLECWLYMPVQENGAPPPPILVMAHGLGAQKDMALHPYAGHFVGAKLAVLVFDYRHFGGSDGEPRHIVDWRLQLEDWESVVLSIKSGTLGLSGHHVDSSRIALWGASYSGAHVLMTAARLGSDVAAVVSNEPYLDGRGAVSKATGDRGPLKMLRLLLIAVHDIVRGKLGLSPAYISLIAKKGDLAILEVTEFELNQTNRNPPRRIGGHRGVCGARMMVVNMMYHPIDHVHKITSPTLLIGGTHDTICPIERIKHAAMLMGDRATMLEKPYGHIELHRRGIEYEENVAIIEFLHRQLNMSATPLQV